MLTFLLIFALLVALWGAYRAGEAHGTLVEARRFTAQGRKRIGL